MKPMEPPKCRLCEKNHWAREGCYGMLVNRNPEGAQIQPAGEPKAAGARSEAPGGRHRPPATNTSREGRRVLKGSTGSAPPAKPTRTASTERADPSTPASAPAEQATGEKPAGGTAKPRRKKKAKKRAKKKAVV